MCMIKVYSSAQVQRLFFDGRPAGSRLPNVMNKIIGGNGIKMSIFLLIYF